MTVKKLSIFVEGQTEQLFMEKLILEIAGQHNVNLELFSATGGNNIPRKITIIKSCDKMVKKYYVQIINSSTDNRVSSDINDSFNNLEKQGFSKIIGLLDVYPKQVTDYTKLNSISNSMLRQSAQTSSKIIFSITEIETWFLKEINHLKSFNSILDTQYIKNKLGYDLINDDLENDVRYHHASNVLDKIYNLVGRTYDKKKNKVQSLVNNIDYENLYINLRDNLISLNNLINELDTFFI